MKKMKKVLFSLILLIMALSITSCEELFTTVSGTISNEDAPIPGAFVLALNGDGNAYETLSQVHELNGSALAAISDVVKGFDLSSNDNGSYTATLLSGGTIYIIAISDDGSGNLDSLDLVGWFGDVDSIKIPNPDTTGIDSITVTYTVPETVTIENGADTTGIDIENMIEYWLLELAQDYLD